VALADEMIFSDVLKFEDRSVVDVDMESTIFIIIMKLVTFGK